MPKQHQPALSLAMSQIIAADAPLLSPSESSWDGQTPLFSPSNDHFSFQNYYTPPSPPLSDGEPSMPALKMRMNMNIDPDFCLPTHQVFDFPEVARPPTPPSRSSSLCIDTQVKEERISRATEIDSDSMSNCGSKRSASPAPSATKKRAIGERVSSKDFVPPDVSGLSKREARLVKNRAAAFLSRQRKREEFECMEVRVAELEQENARLLALTQNGIAGSAPQITQPVELVSEVETLKAQLAAARERERSLSAQLASKSITRDTPVKVEATDSQFSLSSPLRSSSSSTSSVQSAHKSGASLGLMVLLCALPTLLSMRMQSTAPTSFSIPNPFSASSASAYDYNSYMPNEYDWSQTGSSLMDLDARGYPRSQKLEFIGGDSTELDGLGDLDISFDTSPSDDGKIRVRIHPPSSNPSSRSVSPGLTTSSGSSGSQYDMKPEMSPISPISSSSLAMWSGGVDESSNPIHHQNSFSSQFSSFTTSSDSDPFLGVPSSNDYSMPFSQDGTMKYSGSMDSLMPSSGAALDFGQLSEFGMGSEFSIPDSTSGGKRRVRIALKSMPQAGGEGGEWEVQIC